MTFPAATKQALDYFVSMGWSLPQASGIVANLIAESNLNPAAVGDGGQAFGLAQWHSDRQAHFASLMGKPMQGSSLEDQLAFVHAELRQWEKAAGDALAGCAVASAAGAIVSNMDERPADRLGEAARRGAIAEQIFAQYGDTLSTPAGAAPTYEAPTAPVRPEVQVPSPPSGTNFDAFTAPGSPQSLRGASMASPNLTTALQFLPSILSLVPGLGTIAGLANLVLGVIPTQGAAGGSLHGSDYLNLAKTVVDTFTKAVPQAVNEQQAVQMAQADPAIAAQAAHAVLTQPDVAAELAAIAPTLDKISTYDAATNAAVIAGRESAIHTQQVDNGANARLVVRDIQGRTRELMWALGIGVMATAAAKGYWPDMPDYCSMLIPALTLIGGQLMGERKQITGFYFDGTPASNATAIARDAVEATRAVKS